MARLPTAADLGSRLIPQGPEGVVHDRSGEILGASIEDAGNTISQIGAQKMEREDRFAYAQARSQILAADLQTRSALADDPDYATHESRYSEAMTKAVAAASKGLKSNPDRAAFITESRLDVLRGSVQVKEAARGKEIDEGRAGLKETLDRNREAALSAPDEQTRAALIQNTHDTLAAAKENGYLTAQEEQSQQRAWVQDYAEGALVLMSPTEQTQMLEHPEGTIAEHIPSDRRVQLDDAARRQRLADDELSHRYAERAQKDRADAAAKDGDSMLAQGQMTSAWLEAHRDTLDPGDFRYFYGKLSGGDEGPRDAMAYADLRDKAGNGQDVRADARSALQSGDIRTSDYNTLLNEVEAERPGWYKRGVQFIGTSAAVSDLNPDPAAAQRKALMLDDWDQWSTGNPQATADQARKEYQQIVNDYAIVERDKLLILKKKPSYIVGNEYAGTLDLDATEANTLRALDAGEITEEQAKQQAALIAEWRKLYVPPPETKK